MADHSLLVRAAQASKSVSPLRLHASQPLLLKTSKERLAVRTPALRPNRTPTVLSSLRSSSAFDVGELSLRTSSQDVTAVNVQLEIQVADLSHQVQTLQQALLRGSDLEESLKKDLREKARHLAELKTIISDYERKMQTLLGPDLNESKTEELQQQLSVKDRALKESSRLIQQLLKRNKELEARVNDEVLARLQSENRRLKEQLLDIQRNTVKRSDYDLLKRKYGDLEATHEKSQEATSQLQHRLSTLSHNGAMAAAEKMITVSEELLRMNTDLNQITTALRMCHDSQEINLGLLLTISPPKPIGENRDSPTVSCMKALDQVKSEVARLRSVVSDFFAEYCGRGCIQHCRNLIKYG